MLRTQKLLRLEILFQDLEALAFILCIQVSFQTKTFWPPKCFRQVKKFMIWALKMMKKSRHHKQRLLLYLATGNL